MYEYGLSLTGGGARGSYQAGVLHGLFEILNENGMSGSANPFRYFSGVSAGSINASFMAGGYEDTTLVTEQLVKLWSEIQPENVYRTDLSAITFNSAKWVRDLTFGTMFKRKLAHALLDTEPLWDHLSKKIDFKKIQSNVADGRIEGIACSAYNYSTNQTVTFLQTKKECHWDRDRRVSLSTPLKIEHIMASCAIPLLFPSIKVGPDHYADGGFRSLSPFSPMVHMNVRKMMMIGVRGRNGAFEKGSKAIPTLARVSGALLNALFFDTIDIDLERLHHINELLSVSKGAIETSRSSYTAIDYIVIRPSQDPAKIALGCAKNFPKLIRFLMGGLGPMNEASELASYILFVPEFTKRLIALGYDDARDQKDEILRWIERKITH